MKNKVKEPSFIIFFYAVDNELEYDRHTFDIIYEETKNGRTKKSCIKKIKAMLDKLPEEQVRCYNFGADFSHFANERDFEEDYNNEILDGGWWSIVLKP